MCNPTRKTYSVQVKCASTKYGGGHPLAVIWNRVSGSFRGFSTTRRGSAFSDKNTLSVFKRPSTGTAFAGTHLAVYTPGPCRFIFKPPVATRRHYGRHCRRAMARSMNVGPPVRVAVVYAWPLNRPVYTTPLWQDPELCGGVFFVFWKAPETNASNPIRRRYSNRSRAARLLSFDTIDYY